MKIELAHPFITATTSVVGTMCQLTPKVGEPQLKHCDKTWGEISGVIGMVSEKLTGNLVISFDESAVLSLVSKMLMEQFDKMSPEIVDAVGELTNIISGSAKSQFAELGHKFSMATPFMITGKGVGITQLSKAPILQIPFTIPEGTFVVEANLAEVGKA